ncbi:MAG: hypothetical protein Q4F60_02935, partial [Candidatus Saccharibacteria bacterium]|nr:hypothetical protein [Candidatus Saccharibacteria bacterium]
TPTATPTPTSTPTPTATPTSTPAPTATPVPTTIPTSTPEAKTVKTVKTKTEAPVYKEEVPTTGPAETVGSILGIGSIVTSAGYYIASRKKLA